jgi:lysozyme
MFEKLKKQLEFEEGKVLKVYTCTMGHKTIGIGHNLDVNPEYKGKTIPPVITDSLCTAIFNDDITDTAVILQHSWRPFVNLDDARRDALLNMAFQMGVSGVMQFKSMLRALELKDYEGAAVSAKASKWYEQTPERAERVVKQLESGEYYEV